MTVGPYYQGQVPADPLVLTVLREDGTPRDLSAYDSASLLLWNPSGSLIDTSGGTAEIDPSALGRVVYDWPTISLLSAAGTYAYQLELDGPALTT